MKVICASLLLILAVQVGGCGGGEETSPASGDTAEQTKSPPKEKQAKPAPDQKSPAELAKLKKEYADAGRWKVLEKAAGATADRLIIPVGPPPTDEVVIRDLRVGKGAKLDKNDQIQYELLGFDYSEGSLREDTWDQEDHWWIYGAGEINEGVQAGFKGMRKGGMREAIVPAARLNDDDAAVYLIRLTKVFKE